MTVIGTVEDAMIASLMASPLMVPDRLLRACESLPANFDIEELAARRHQIPGLFVAFLGGPSKKTAPVPTIDATYAVFAISDNAGGEKARRRGSSTAIGAYDMIEIAVPVLDQLKVAGVATLQLDDVGNLFSGALDKLGLSLYSASFKIPLRFELPASMGNITPFEEFNADWDMNNRHGNVGPLPITDPNQRDAEDMVELPQ